MFFFPWVHFYSIEYKTNCKRYIFVKTQSTYQHNFINCVDNWCKFNHKNHIITQVVGDELLSYRAGEHMLFWAARINWLIYNYHHAKHYLPTHEQDWELQSTQYLVFPLIAGAVGIPATQLPCVCIGRNSYNYCHGKFWWWFWRSLPSSLSSFFII